jgi:hypothetical protein
MDGRGQGKGGGPADDDDDVCIYVPRRSHTEEVNRRSIAKWMGWEVGRSRGTLNCIALHCIAKRLECMCV